MCRRAPVTHKFLRCNPTLSQRKTAASAAVCQEIFWLHGYWLFYVDWNAREPAKAVGRGAVHNSVEFFLDRLGDWPGDAVLNADLVHGADGGNFGGCAAEENFIGDGEHFARDHLLRHRYAKVFGDAEYRVAGDSWQHGVAQRSGQQSSLPHHEDVFAGAFAH